MRENGDANCIFPSVCIPDLDLCLDRDFTPHSSLTHLKDARFCLGSTLGSRRGFCGFACLSVAEKKMDAMRPRQRRRMGRDDGYWPIPTQLAKHPLAVVALVPREDALFLAGAVVGAAAKTVTAPLDRIKLLMQTHGMRFRHQGAKKAMGFVEEVNWQNLWSFMNDFIPIPAKSCRGEIPTKSCPREWYFPLSSGSGPDKELSEKSRQRVAVGEVEESSNPHKGAAVPSSQSILMEYRSTCFNALFQNPRFASVAKSSSSVTSLLDLHNGEESEGLELGGLI